MQSLLQTSALAALLAVCGPASMVAAASLQDSSTPDAEDQDEPLLLPDPGSRLSDPEPVLELPQSPSGVDPLLRRERTLRQGRDFETRGIAVLDRRRPDYDPVGIRTGGFTVFPQATVGLGVETNVYREPNGRADVFGYARAEALARSNWSRNQAVLDGFVQQSLYVSQGGESEATYMLRGAGRLDVNRQDTITAQVLTERVAEDRGSVIGDVDTFGSIVSNRVRAAAAGRVVRGRVNGQVRLAYGHVSYEDESRGFGQPSSQNYRTSNQYEIGTQLGYQISPGRVAFASVDYEQRRYPNPSPSFVRDLDQTEFLVGLESEITPLIRGRVGVGYLHADFKDPAIRTRGGLAVDVQASYLFTELTTFNLQARRYVRNVASPRSPAALATTLRLGADHEYLRNVIISPAVFYEHADYVGTEARAQQIGASVDVRWLINRRFRAGLTTAYRKRDGENFIVNRDYSSFTALASLTWQR